MRRSRIKSARTRSLGVVFGVCTVAIQDGILTISVAIDQIGAITVDQIYDQTNVNHQLKQGVGGQDTVGIMYTEQRRQPAFVCAKGTRRAPDRRR